VLIKLFVLAMLAPFILTLPACLATSKASSSDLKEAVAVVDTTREDVRVEICRGQTPQTVDPATYDTLPDFAKQYIINNARQWVAAGCKGT
jgi:ABC-type transport system substrate-binding protein